MHHVHAWRCCSKRARSCTVMSPCMYSVTSSVTFLARQRDEARYLHRPTSVPSVSSAARCCSSAREPVNERDAGARADPRRSSPARSGPRGSTDPRHRAARARSSASAGAPGSPARARAAAQEPARLRPAGSASRTGAFASGLPAIALRTEASRVDGGLARLGGRGLHRLVERRLRPRASEADQRDAQPASERALLVEALESLEHAEPGLLDEPLDLARVVGPQGGDAREGRMVTIHQRQKRALVAGADQPRLVRSCSDPCSGQPLLAGSYTDSRHRQRPIGNKLGGGWPDLRYVHGPRRHAALLRPEVSCSIRSRAQRLSGRCARR